MTSRERLLAVLAGRAPDHVPLTTWSFGFPAPPGLGWRTAEREVPYWYSLRLEHLHTLPYPWTVDDEFRRVLAWRMLDVDDVIEVSVPWSQDPEVAVTDTVLAAGAVGGDERYPLRIRDYQTPSGPLRHAVRQTGVDGPGWPIQPRCVPLVEDYNIPRAVRHLVGSPADIPAMRHLYAPPDGAQAQWLRQRLDVVRPFAEREGFLVQAWTAFGMDAVVWFAGTEAAVLLALDAPAAFGQLVEIIAATDYARTELALQTPGIDMVCQRGWYSSTDFWSPALFDAFVVPHVTRLAALAHRYGRRFAYVMTTGVERLGPRLADAGVDLLYFVDPIQDRAPLARLRDTLGGRMTLVGGTNALSLASGDPARIRREVHEAVALLGPTNRFVLHPVDALFPDTPWAGLETLIDAWRECR
jgi:hypothetical protein